MARVVTIVRIRITGRNKSFIINFTGVSTIVIIHTSFLRSDSIFFLADLFCSIYLYSKKGSGTHARMSKPKNILFEKYFFQEIFDRLTRISFAVPQISSMRICRS